ncbi:hypothetical protein NDU88_002873 [Pleurodeles waltl]|uniref:Uncharacterized protein n=1 Tax=Pleurodeles waltl TaxID=8319 RepID=A0AAV7UCG6_PLEWA|nr:hypothetical protein NDU88_002873 [Pleurodeles waltl]
METQNKHTEKGVEIGDAELNPSSRSACIKTLRDLHSALLCYDTDSRALQFSDTDGTALRSSDTDGTALRSSDSDARAPRSSALTLIAEICAPLL